MSNLQNLRILFTLERNWFGVVVMVLGLLVRVRLIMQYHRGFRSLTEQWFIDNY